MSVSHRKINGLIEKVINKSDSLVDNDKDLFISKEALIELCKTIYLHESSTESMSRTEMIRDIRKEILWHADRCIGK